MAKTVNPQVLKQQIMNDIDSINDKYFTEASSSINNLIDLKVALHEHDKILDDQIDDFKARIVSAPRSLTSAGHRRRQHQNNERLSG